MCFGTPIFSVIIGDVRGALQMLPDRGLKAEVQPEGRGRASGGSNNDDEEVKCLVGCSERSIRILLRRRVTRKAAQPKKNDNHARQDVTDYEGATVTRAQVKNSDKSHPLKVKEAVSTIDKFTTDDIQKKGFNFEEMLQSSMKTNHQRELHWRVLHEEWITLPETSIDEYRMKF